MENFKGKRVLITGGAGFIGSNLAHRFLDLGADVTVYDILKPEFNANVANIEEIKDKINLIKADIRDFDKISQAIKDQDIIFHCAAQTSHIKSTENPHLDLDINCLGTLNLLEAVRKFNSNAKLVYIGTSTQIGKMHYSPIDEFHPEFPRELYSAHKSISEKYHLIYNYVHKLNTTVVRASNCYGPRAAIHSKNFGFFNYFIGLAFKNQDITIYRPGLQKRTIIYINDLIDALVKAASSDKVNGEVLFAVGDKQYSVREIAESIVNIIGGNLKEIEWPEERKAIEVGDAKISNKKIKEVLSWTPKFDLISGLKETKEYYKNKLDKYL